MEFPKILKHICEILTDSLSTGYCGLSQKKFSFVEVFLK